MRVKKLYEPIFRTDVIFITESDPKQVHDYLKKIGYHDKSFYDSTSGSVTLLDKTDHLGRQTREYLVIVEGKKDFYTLLHETIHLVHHILSDRMIPVNEKNTEIIAYLSEYWFRTLWRFMGRKIVKLENKKIT